MMSVDVQDYILDFFPTNRHEHKSPWAT